MVQHSGVDMLPSPGERTMESPIPYVRSVAFRHVLEDALSAIDGGIVGTGRLGYIVKDLRELFDDAMAGCRFISGQSGFIGLRGDEALDAYDLVRHCLDISDDANLTAALEIVISSLDALRNGTLAKDRAKELREALDSLAQRAPYYSPSTDSDFDA